MSTSPLPYGCCDFLPPEGGGDGNTQHGIFPLGLREQEQGLTVLSVVYCGNVYTYMYTYIYLRSGFYGPEYFYSVISVIDKRLPVNMGARQAFAARRKVCNRFVHGQPVVRGVINPRMSTPEEKEGLD